MNNISSISFLTLTCMSQSSFAWEKWPAISERRCLFPDQKELSGETWAFGACNKLSSRKLNTEMLMECMALYDSNLSFSDNSEDLAVRGFFHCFMHFSDVMIEHSIAECSKSCCLQELMGGFGWFQTIRRCRALWWKDRKWKIRLPCLFFGLTGHEKSTANSQTLLCCVMRSVLWKATL